MLVNARTQQPLEQPTEKPTRHTCQHPIKPHYRQFCEKKKLPLPNCTLENREQVKTWIKEEKRVQNIKRKRAREEKVSRQSDAIFGSR